MTRGVVYMAWGENAMTEATKSIISLWQHKTDLPILMLGDAITCEAFNGNGVQTRQVEVDPFRKVEHSVSRPDAVEFLHGRLFPLLYDLSPFTETLYLDADTEFMFRPKQAFDFLRNWDLVVAETEQRSVNAFRGDPKEFNWTRWWIGGGDILYHNAGVFLWRRCSAMKDFFRLWGEEWRRFENWDSQIAFLRALARSRILFLTLPHTWNSYRRDQAVFLAHHFGSKRAWKTPWSNK